MKTYWAAFLMRAKMEAQYRAAALSGLATQDRKSVGRERV